jgi:hypothetical protein
VVRSCTNATNLPIQVPGRPSKRGGQWTAEENLRPSAGAAFGEVALARSAARPLDLLSGVFAFAEELKQRLVEFLGMADVRPVWTAGYDV